MSKRKAKTRSSARSRRVREAQNDPHRLAQAYLRWRGLRASTGWSLKFWRGEWWVWDGKRYRVLPEPDLRAEVTKAIKQEYDRWAKALAARSKKKEAFMVAKVTTDVVRNVVQALAGLVLIPASIAQPAWVGQLKGRGTVIAMANGLLDLDPLIAKKPDVLRVHSPDWFSPVYLDYSYDPNAKCPRFDAFLRQVLEGDEERIALAWEWIGYCLTYDTSHEKFLIAIGEGKNGKSVFVSVLIALLGEDNVSSVPLELFSSRFQLASTLGKLANIASEIGETDRLSEGMLKSYVSGNRMNFDQKFLSSVEFCPRARLTFTTNELPKFRDKTEGIWRRLIVLPFLVIIAEDQRDLQLSEKLKAELSGIFNSAIEALRRLRAQKRFTEPAICRHALEEYRCESNSARAFLKEFVRARPGVNVACPVLHQQYGFWCIGESLEAFNEKQFGKEVARLFPSVKRRRGQRDPTGNRPWIYDGIEYVTADTAMAAIPAARPRVRPRPAVAK